MKPERILLPINVAQCPLEVFDLVNGMAKRPEVTVYLLHVVTLNIMAEGNRISAEMTLEARMHLSQLAERFIHPIVSAVSHVRVGNLEEEILAEAKAEHVDLIILTSYGPSFWSRFLSLWRSGSEPVASVLVERIVREATCGVFVFSAKGRFNCVPKRATELRGQLENTQRGS